MIGVSYSLSVGEVALGGVEVYLGDGVCFLGELNIFKCSKVVFFILMDSHSNF